MIQPNATNHHTSAMMSMNWRPSGPVVTYHTLGSNKATKAM